MGPDLQAVTEKDAPLRYALVLNQGCDIVKPHPWIKVAPVYDAVERLDRGRLGHVRNGNIAYLLALSPPWASEHQKYVADLRLEIPIEKTVLLEREPLAAYANDEDYARVAQRLAYLSQRPAVAVPCIDHIAKPFFTWLNAVTVEKIREVRLWQNDPTSPTVASLYIVFESDVTSSDRETLSKGFDILYPGAHEAGITLLKIEGTTLKTMPTSDYLISMAITDESNS